MKKRLMIAVLMVGLALFGMFVHDNDKKTLSKRIDYNGNNLKISIDGVGSTTLPTSGDYYLANYTCKSADTVVTWDRTSYQLKVKNKKKKASVSCYLDFQTHPKLADMRAGSYVAYVGNNGCEGDSCSGENANYVSDNNMGYCYSSKMKFARSGWRLAYVEDGTAYLISAGSPECMCTNSDGSSGTTCNSYESKSSLVNHITNLNKVALKYCNASYAYGLKCDDNSAWNMDNEDYHRILFGLSKRNNLYSCYGVFSDKRCGYANDLIDNGSYYWYGTANQEKVISTYFWYPDDRLVSSVNSNYAYGVRPVLRLNSSVIVVGGDGTYESPYQLASYSFEIDGGSSYVETTSDEIDDDSSKVKMMAKTVYPQKRSIELTLNGIDVSRMCISLNTSSCTNYVDFSNKYTLDLSKEADGEKIVYVYYKDGNGNLIASLQQSIILDTKPPQKNKIQIANGDGLIRELTISSDGASLMCFSNVSDKIEDCTNWVDYATNYTWRLRDEGKQKVVYAFFKDKAGNIANVVSDSVMVNSACLDFNDDYVINYSGNVVTSEDTDVQFCAGNYRFEVWGAQGGNAGGKGGYSKGEITLDGTELLYFYVGGAGAMGTAGFNGGGMTGLTGGGGGGATDIRINTDSLLARVIVAGGGGGAGRDSCAIGAVGGGLIGGGNANQNSCGLQGGAGTQSTGGEVGSYQAIIGAHGGTFGVGGSAQDTSFDGGAGGGGWYGGGAGVSASWSSGGGGGSGFVYSSDSVKPIGYLLGSNYYMRNISLLSGDQLIPNVSSNTLDRGHASNGMIRITRVA